MKVKACDVYGIDKALYNLVEQQVKLPLNIGYAVYKMYKQVSDAAEYIAERLTCVIDEERMRLNQLTEDESAIYNAVMQSEIDIVPFSISREELFGNKEVELSLSEIANIDELFREN